jgi:hypothetical protein
MYVPVCWKKDIYSFKVIGDSELKVAVHFLLYLSSHIHLVQKVMNGHFLLQSSPDLTIRSMQFWYLIYTQQFVLHSFMHIWYPVFYNTETQCLSSWICFLGERFLLIWVRLKELFILNLTEYAPLHEIGSRFSIENNVFVFFRILDGGQFKKRKGSNTACNTPSSVLSWKAAEKVEVHFMLDTHFFLSFLFFFSLYMYVVCPKRNWTC